MQYQTFHRPPETRPVTIEVDGEPLGVVVPSETGYRFLAVRLSAFDIDGRIFSSIEAARDALSDVVRPRDDA